MAVFNIKAGALTSEVAVDVPRPVGYPSTGSPFGAIAFAGDRRAVTVVDLNDDGFLDIFLHPSYYQYGPVLAPVVLVNDGSGRFSEGTASVFPTLPVEHSNGVFFKDFNRDGRLDMFVVDQGLELGGDPRNFPGAQNRLYIRQSDGTFQDATAALPGNVAAFNHVSTIADINADGNLDVLITRLSGPGGGTFFYLNDGNDRFTFSTAGLPDEIRYLLHTERQWQTTTINYQFSGTNAAGDLDNDGRLDLVTGSYGRDQLSDARTIRVFQQQSSGEFVAKWQGLESPALVAAGLTGVAGIETGDLDRDGLRDLVVYWESSGKNAIQVLKNLGGLQFADVTGEWLGSHLVRESVLDSTGGFQQQYTGVQLQDVNRDGALDLVLKNYGASAAQVVAGLPTGAFLYLNDGSGHFSPAIPSIGGNSLTVSQLAALTGTAHHVLGIPLLFDANSDGNTDQIFIGLFNGLDQSSFPYKVTKLHVSTLLGEDTSHVYRAGDVDDVLVGSAERDVLYSGAGWDLLNGAGGIDRAVYDGPKIGYTVARSGADWIVADRATGRDGTDTLSSVERVEFADVSVALDDAAVMTAKVLGAAFGAEYVQNREFVAIGLSLFDAGMTYVQVASLAANSPFFASLAGSHSNRDFVNYVYSNVVGARPSSSELDMFVGLLESGQFTQGTLAVLAAETTLNQQNIDLVGLQQSGLEYL
jgi:hypothetical protein